MRTISYFPGWLQIDAFSSIHCFDVGQYGLQNPVIITHNSSLLGYPLYPAIHKLMPEKNSTSECNAHVHQVMMSVSVKTKSFWSLKHHPQVKSFHSWSSHLFCGPPGGRCHLRSGRLSDTLMWSWRAMFAGVLSSSRATCRNTETRQRDRRWDSEVRPVRCCISSFRTWSYHRIPSSCLRHIWWKASRVLTCLLIVRSTCLWHIVT